MAESNIADSFPGNISPFPSLIPTLKNASHHLLWSSYDAEADTLYINFKKPSHATDSEWTDDDVILRYEGEEIVGLTVLHASQRPLKTSG